ncbi:hypothetical protein ElyMa_000312900 [Elysia marginata]|uniref:Uncharacterized protein n=1 Tax=Elysia marginata TaxID=1093978 RepID=A0AAV4FB52_9GAST|nr:hypothetical protein ElyMa_000312900 [Elysia marginata]
MAGFKIKTRGQCFSAPHSSVVALGAVSTIVDLSSRPGPLSWGWTPATSTTMMIRGEEQNGRKRTMHRQVLGKVRPRFTGTGKERKVVYYVLCIGKTDQVNRNIYVSISTTIVVGVVVVVVFVIVVVAVW